MPDRRICISLSCFALLAVSAFTWAPARASGPDERKDDHPIRVDIPVALEKADVVFNMDHQAFVGDMSIGMNWMKLMSNRFRDWHTAGHIIGVFHGDAAYFTLNDSAYNAYRKVTTGNPHKGFIAELQKLGVQIEECGVSMKNHGWGNEDLLPGVKVNSGAVGRIIQLVQSGYVQIQP